MVPRGRELRRPPLLKKAKSAPCPSGGRYTDCAAARHTSETKFPSGLSGCPFSMASTDSASACSMRASTVSLYGWIFFSITESTRAVSPGAMPYPRVSTFCTFAGAVHEARPAASSQRRAVRGRQDTADIPENKLTISREGTEHTTRTSHVCNGSTGTRTLRRNRPDGLCLLRRVRPVLRSGARGSVAQPGHELPGNGRERHPAPGVRLPGTLPETGLLRRAADHPHHGA